MRKRTISPPARETGGPTGEWLSLAELAEVEITSEAPKFPIEGALELHVSSEGWRAATPGAQTIRIRFDAPRSLRRVRLVFEEHERARTQEFVLRCLPESGGWREIVRQQFNFAPAGANREEEEYRLELDRVSALELAIVPDLSGGDAPASLRQLRVA